MIGYKRQTMTNEQKSPVNAIKWLMSSKLNGPIFMTQHFSLNIWKKNFFLWAFTWEDTTGHDLALLDSLRNGFVERSGVSDARHATVANDVEPESLEVGNDAGLAKVVGDHSTAYWKKNAILGWKMFCRLKVCFRSSLIMYLYLSRYHKSQTELEASSINDVTGSRILWRQY